MCAFNGLHIYSPLEWSVIKSQMNLEAILSMSKIFLLTWMLQLGFFTIQANDSKGSLIVRLGINKISENIVLEIVENDEGILEASLKSKTTGELLIDDRTRASQNQRWFYCWDMKTRDLWFWSSDVGGHRWRWTLNGKYSKEELTGIHEKMMPIIFLEKIPLSVRKLWGQYR